MKKSNIIVSVFFLLLLSIITVASMTNPVRDKSESENRELAQMPTLNFDTLLDTSGKGFTKGYEKFVTDQFVWRDSWIGIKASFERFIGKSVFNNVYVADDGYFIEYRSESSLDKMTIEHIDNNIRYLKKFVEETNGKLSGNTVIAIAPTAALVHKDKLPRFTDEYDWEKLLSKIKEAVGDNYVDIYTVLKNHSDEYIYYRTDHHWTTDGAYLAYTEIIKEFGFEPVPKEEFDIKPVTEDFYGTVISKVNMNSQPDKIYVYEPQNGFDVTVQYAYEDKNTFFFEDKLETKDKYSYFFGGNPGFLKITSHNAESERSLVIAKDSYANCMIPFFASHFETIYVVDLREYNVLLADYINKELPQGSKRYEIMGATDALVLYNVSSFIDSRELNKLA